MLVALFIVVPLVELYLIIEVGRALGAAETVALLIVISVVGAWLAKRQGLAVLGRIRAQLEAGLLPGRELVDGALVLVAGVLLLTPGFLTDTVALLLLLPPVRAFGRRLLVGRWRRRLVRVESTWRVQRPPAGPTPDEGGNPPPAIGPGPDRRS